MGFFLILRMQSDMEGAIIMNCKANHCIECTVQQCAYHCSGENYWTLDRILVGTHEQNPTMTECTDCKSFKLR